METSARTRRRCALPRFYPADFVQRLVPRSKAWRGVRTGGVGGADRRRRQELAVCPSVGQAGGGARHARAGSGAACGLEGGVVQTDDGGKSWRFAHQSDKPGAAPDTLVPGAAQIPARDPLFSIDLFAGDNGITTGLTGSALRLQPNGAWAHDPSVPAIPFPLSQVRFFDAHHGWIVGYGTILYTEDGGKSWRLCQG